MKRPCPLASLQALERADKREQARVNPSNENYLELLSTMVLIFIGPCPSTNSIELFYT